MKVKAKVAILCFVVVIVAVGLFFTKVSAQSATQQQITQIKTNCLSIKNTLNQLLVSDALLRVNMGQRYELVSTRLMDRFNSRVSGNCFNIDNLSVAANSYKNQLDNFRNDYIAYEESLASTIKIDCSNQPSEFYDSLVSTRVKRGQVYNDVTGLDYKISQYRSAVSDFESKYQSSSGGKQ
jgi:cell division protein FtsL